MSFFVSTLICFFLKKNNFKNLFYAFCILRVACLTAATNEPVVEHPHPTWETQKQARTFQLSIPAPRGQITDRHGEPLAQTRTTYNLALQFPTPLDSSDQKAVAFAKQYITFAQGKLGHPINISDQAILKHYHHRGLLPLDLIENLQPEELALARRGLSPWLIVRQTYARFYPQNELAAHLIGYTGREAPLSIRPIENHDLIFPEIEGREGIEQIFDGQLRGHPGNLFVTYNDQEKRNSERISQRPIPGDNVITTIDENLQRICEKVLRENCRRGAIVFLDPNTGEIHAMASFPQYNLNDFVPTINPQIYQQLSKDPDVPLLPRSFRSAYPPGSTFKTVVGVAALQSGQIRPSDTFHCPPTFDVGNVTFHNWKKVDVGRLNFVQAFTQSCNTWFY
ncbi:MAG: penicillin-binding transpeptidase domain-containing protein, partial [Chthoniobacterales bacterium]